MELPPSLILLSGTPGTGKSATLLEILKKVPNAFVIGKDLIDHAGLHVKPTTQGNLVPFNKYVSNDDPMILEQAQAVLTPVGEMMLVKPRGEHYGRHVRDQCYLVMGE